MKKDVLWNENGWTTVQEADAKKHILEIMCYAENGEVKELRKRHNDGEEEVFKTRLANGASLPMPLAEFKYIIGDLIK